MFDHLDPARTAHIIVDLQNGFMESPGDGREPRGIIIVEGICAARNKKLCFGHAFPWLSEHERPPAAGQKTGGDRAQQPKCFGGNIYSAASRAADDDWRKPRSSSVVITSANRRTRLLRVALCSASVFVALPSATKMTL
jgi:hypothetical protein